MITTALVFEKVMHDHRAAVSGALSELESVEQVRVDLASGTVEVRGLANRRQRSWLTPRRRAAPRRLAVGVPN